MENSPEQELAENEKQLETSLRGSGRVAKRICFISVGELEVSSVFFFCCSSGWKKKKTRSHFVGSAAGVQ